MYALQYAHGIVACKGNVLDVVWQQMLLLVEACSSNQLLAPHTDWDFSANVTYIHHVQCLAATGACKVQKTLSVQLALQKPDFS